VTEDKIERALAARRLVEDGEFKRACDALRSEYIDEWQRAKTLDEREDFHRLVKTLDRLTLDLISVITTGEIEAQSRQKT
jgi:hypothetical protein